MNHISTKQQFSDLLLAWWQVHGRHDLPWKTTEPYQVWVSEIMLQQTQVSRVLDFYTRFITAFPTVRTLAAAPLDHVLHYWSGLGYYARARNLHKAAGLIAASGTFPRDAESLVALPGIGISTAHAIMAQAFNIRVPILDANVKRILARYYGLKGNIATAATEQQLWRYADLSMPQRQANDYTQAIMDLGALVCQKTPNCANCPLKKNCYAYTHACVDQLPHKAKKALKPIRTEVFWLLHHTNSVLLYRRPEKGIWGGLWCLPTDAELYAGGYTYKAGRAWLTQKHSFTHFHLDYTVRLAQHEPVSYTPNPSWIWCDTYAEQSIGLPSPIQKVLHKWQNQHPD